MNMCNIWISKTIGHTEKVVVTNFKMKKEEEFFPYLSLDYH